MAATLKTPPKITVQIWRPILDKLAEKLDTACLRRDAYLNRLLETELPHLNAEVRLPNSEAAQRYVAARLDTLDRKIVSLSLRPDLVAQLNAICHRLGIGRDSFFNRVFLLLAASPRLIDRLLFNDVEIDNWRVEVWSERKHEGPFFQNVFSPLDPEINPFWAIREGLDYFGDDEGIEEIPSPLDGTPVHVRRNLTGGLLLVESVYSSIFTSEFPGADLTGLNCYLPDWMVPGSDADLAHRKTLDELLGF